MDESGKVGLRREDALCRSIRIASITQIVTILKCVWPPSLVGLAVTFFTLIRLSLY